MKKTKMNAAKLQLGKDRISSMEQGDVLGGLPIQSLQGYTCPGSLNCVNPFPDSTIHYISNGGVNVLSVCMCKTP